MMSGWLSPKKRNLASDCGFGNRNQVYPAELRAILGAVPDLSGRSACGRLATTLENQVHARDH